MSTLARALVLPLVAAAAFGALLGVAAARGRSGYTPGEHPFFDALLKRRNPVVSAVFTVVAWSAVLYLIPRLSFAFVGIDDLAAFGLSVALQLCVLATAFLCAERVWARIA